MTLAAEPTEPTDADRETARRLLSHAYCQAECCECTDEDDIEAVARALAAERVRACDCRLAEHGLHRLGCAHRSRPGFPNHVADPADNNLCPGSGQLDDGDRCQHCGALWITCGCDC